MNPCTAIVYNQTYNNVVAGRLRAADNPAHESPDGLFAIMVKQGTTETMYYVHKDYLGSISAITDATGNLIESLSYDAWGRRRKATDWTDYNVPSTLFDRGFTGHEHLSQFGLINMNGRVYDPFLARFLSPDPFVQAPGYTQNYNRYSYAWNNPLKYTDPSGYYIDGNRDYTPAHIYLDSGGSSGSWLSGNQMYMTGGFGPGSGRHWSDSFSRSWQVNILRMNARFFEYSYGTSVLYAHRLNKVQNNIRSTWNRNNTSANSGSAPTSHDATHQRYWQEGYGMSFDGEEDGDGEEDEQISGLKPLHGWSIDGVFTVTSGYSLEYGEIYDPNTGQLYQFRTKGPAYGLEASFSVNYLLIIPKDGFNISHLEGTSWGWAISAGGGSFSMSGNSTPALYGGTIFDTFTMYKFGIGPGFGGNNTPRSSTNFYDWIPSRLWW